MAESLPRRRRLTVRDYHLMGERGILPPDARVELIEGAIIDMAPIGSRHAGIVEHIADLLRSAGAEGVMVRTQQPISLDEHSEPEPDIVVVPRRADYYKSAHPGPRDVMLVVEVAESSSNYDSATKLPPVCSPPHPRGVDRRRRATAHQTSGRAARRGVRPSRGPGPHRTDCAGGRPRDRGRPAWLVRCVNLRDCRAHI